MSSSQLFRAAGFCVLCCVSATAAEIFKVGDSFVGFQTPDQHGVPFTFKAGDAKIILIDSPGDGGPAESPKPPDWFAKNQALLVVNITDFSFFKRKIARSRLEAKPFRLMVVDDSATASRLPKQTGKLTVLRVDEQGKITAIGFGAPGKEMQALLPDAK